MSKKVSLVTTLLPIIYLLLGRITVGLYVRRCTLLLPTE